MFFTTAALAALAGVAAAKDGRTFAVLHHYGKGPLMTGRVDPIISPGQISSHVHTVMGGSNFGMSVTGEELRQSRCTTALPKGDSSNYWFPALYFQDPTDGHFEPVEMFYMNVYYFFEGTNDVIKSFPVGMQMVAGDAMRRTAPNTNGTLNLDPSEGTVQPLQWTCPRANNNYDPPSWPAGSDGSKAGIQDPNNQGSGIGLPFANCDGYASPLRMDLHFPSCYNPAAGLTDYKTNTAYPTSAGSGKADCPEGWIHLPHLFYEVYWNTPKFIDRWTPNEGSQPFVLANGDRTGYSGHGDFIAGWDEDVLQQIIDNCDAGDSGMDKCPGLLGGLNDASTSCNIDSPVNEVISGNLTALPGNNPVVGWGLGSGSASSSSVKSSAAPATSASASSASVKSSAAPATSASAKTVSTKAAVSSAASSPAVVSSASTSPIKVVSATTTTTTPLSTVAPKDGEVAAPTSTATPAAPANGTDSDHASIAGYAYVGCYKDTRTRVLSGEVRPNLGAVSNTLCVAHCKSNGWTLAGTEYGGQCYCDNELAGSALLDEAECDKPCEGDAAQICGGGWALSVYSANGSAKLVAAAQKRHLRQHAHARARRGSF